MAAKKSETFITRLSLHEPMAKLKSVVLTFQDASPYMCPLSSLSCINSIRPTLSWKFTTILKIHQIFEKYKVSESVFHCKSIQNNRESIQINQNAYKSIKSAYSWIPCNGSIELPYVPKFTVIRSKCYISTLTSIYYYVLYSNFRVNNLSIINIGYK